MKKTLEGVVTEEELVERLVEYCVSNGEREKLCDSMIRLLSHRMGYYIRGMW